MAQTPQRKSSSSATERNGRPIVSVVSCHSYDPETLAAVREAIRLAGGIIVKKGMKVLIKPNLLSCHLPEQAITTHPAVVDALCTILKEEGAEIWIGDSSGIQMSDSQSQEERIYGATGMAAVAEKHCAKLVSFSSRESVKVRNEMGVVIREFRAAKPVLDADYIIDVPKLKTHSLCKYTGAVKNMFGCLPGGGKGWCHIKAPSEERFSQLLLDIYQVLTPDFVVMDGIIGLEGDGPGTAGMPKQTGIIMASRDGIALDMIACNIIGFKPHEVLTNSKAVERGMATASIEVVGEKAIHVSYRRPQGTSKMVQTIGSALIFTQITPRPGVVKENCKKCGVCCSVCPVHAIRYTPYPVWDWKKCILCYRCQELCPHQAIVLKRPAPVELLLSLYRKVIKRKG